MQNPDPLPDPSPLLARPLIIVTGFSGAGKSTALQVFEDIGYFTADGLPPNMLEEIFQLFNKPDMAHFTGLALGLDFKRAKFEGALTALNTIRSQGGNPLLLFLSAKPEALMRRYGATRRPHPLEREGFSLDAALKAEITRLLPIRKAADVVIDTSAYSLHDLRRELQRRFSNAHTQIHSMRVHILSFGFKYGLPADAELVFDARCLPNPHFDETLRPLSGKDTPVADFVLKSPEGITFADQFLTFLQETLPLYDKEGRYRICIAIGCTGGRHRSVALAELLAQNLRQADYNVQVEHRHLDLGG